MKLKILSLCTLFAMVVSIFITDTPLFTGIELPSLATNASASEPADDANRLRVIVLYNGEPIASSRHRDVGFDFNSFVNRGTITLRVEDNNGNPVSAARIHYTTSTMASGSTFPAQGAASMAPGQVAAASSPFGRHDGGVIPAPRTADGNGVTPSARATTVNGGTATIEVPTREANREVFTISAVAVSTAGTFRPSHPVTRSLILETNRWDQSEMMIFAVYSDATGLYGHNDGILIPGRDRERWIERYRALNGNRRPVFENWGADQEFYPPTLPANYNWRGRSAERPAFIEMFDPKTGYRHINQTVGLRMKGGWSRGTLPIEQRTFEYYGRNTYNEYCRGGENTFLFPLFGEQNVLETGANSGNLQLRFRRFRTRNGGTDREQAYMRDEMGSELVRQTGMLLPQNYRPAVVYLNGAYYGFTFMKTPRTENAWMRIMGGSTDRFHHIGGSESVSQGCFTMGCGRLNTTGPGVQTNMTAGTRTYSGLRPNTCNGTTFSCGRAICAEDDNDQSREPVCDTYGAAECRLAENLGGSGHTRPSPSTNHRYCKAVCDWQELRSLMIGEGAFGHAGTGGTAATPNGLSTSARWEEFNRRIDVENLIQYYALQLFAANIDWPGNNMEMWRYFPTKCGIGVLEGATCGPTEGRCNFPNNPAIREYRLNDIPGKADVCEKNDPELHPYLRDGRWRIHPHDIEYGYALWQNGDIPSGTGYAANNMAAILTRRRNGTNDDRPAGISSIGDHFSAAGSGNIIFPTLMAREDVRTKFANTMADFLAPGAALDPGANNATNYGTGSVGTFNRLRRSFAFEHARTIAQNPNAGGRRVTEYQRSQTSLTAGPNGAWPTWEGAIPTAMQDTYNFTGTIAGVAAPTGNNSDMIRNFLARRPNFIRHQLHRTLNRNINFTGAALALEGSTTTVPTATADMTINLTVQGNGDVVMNTRPVGQINPTTNVGTRRPTDPDPRVGGRTITVSGDGVQSVTNATATGRYLTTGGATIPIIANPWPGFRVDWSQAGAPVAIDPHHPTNPNRRIISANGTHNLRVVFVPDETFMQRGDLTISTINSTSYDSRAEDWVEIHNRTGRSVSTRGLYLSDAGTNNPLNRYKSELPPIIVRPGEKVYFPTSRNNRTHTQGSVGTPFLKRTQLSFNIGLAERVRLTSAEGKEIVRVDVTYLLPHQVQSRMLDGNFRVIIPPCELCKRAYADCICPCLFNTGVNLGKNRGGCGERIPLCRCCYVCHRGTNGALPCHCAPCTDSTPPCGGTITHCYCSPFVITNTLPPGGEPRVTLLGVRQIGQDGNNPRFIWEVRVRVVAGTSNIENWELQGHIGTATLWDNAVTVSPPSPSWQLVHSRVGTTDRHNGFQRNLTGGMLRLWGRNQNGDYRHINVGDTVTVTFQILVQGNDPPVLSRPVSCTGGCGRFTFNCTCCTHCKRTPCQCPPCPGGCGQPNGLGIPRADARCQCCAGCLRSVPTCACPNCTGCNNRPAACTCRCSGPCGNLVQCATCTTCPNPRCGCVCGPQITAVAVTNDWGSSGTFGITFRNGTTTNFGVFPETQVAIFRIPLSTFTDAGYSAPTSPPNIHGGLGGVTWTISGGFLIGTGGPGGQHHNPSPFPAGATTTFTVPWTR